jgi:hypothetical protein
MKWKIFLHDFRFYRGRVANAIGTVEVFRGKTNAVFLWRLMKSKKRWIKGGWDSNAKA